MAPLEAMLPTVLPFFARGTERRRSVRTEPTLRARAIGVRAVGMILGDVLVATLGVIRAVLVEIIEAAEAFIAGGRRR